MPAAHQPMLHVWWRAYGLIQFHIFWMTPVFWLNWYWTVIGTLDWFLYWHMQVRNVCKWNFLFQISNYSCMCRHISRDMFACSFADVCPVQPFCWCPCDNWTRNVFNSKCHAPVPDPTNPHSHSSPNKDPLARSWQQRPHHTPGILKHHPLPFIPTYIRKTESILHRHSLYIRTWHCAVYSHS